jgi:hypothetical protein
MVGGVCFGNGFEGSSGAPTEIFFGGFCRGTEENTETLSSVIAFWSKFEKRIFRI